MNRWDGNLERAMGIEQQVVRYSAQERLLGALETRSEVYDPLNELQPAAQEDLWEQ